MTTTTETLEPLDAVFTSVNFAADEPSRTITGLVLPWGTTGRNWQGKWTFQRGSVEWDATNLGRVKFIAAHDTSSLSALIGVATDIVERADGLWATFRVAQTPAGDEALTLVKDGILDGLSVGIVLTDPELVTPVEVDGKTVYTVTGGAWLREVSAVSIPAFADARIQSVNASGEHLLAGPSPTFLEEIRMTATTPEKTDVPAAAAPVTTPEIKVNLDGAGIEAALTAGLKEQHEAFTSFLEKFGEKLETPGEAPGPVASVTEHSPYSFAGGLGNDSMVRDLWNSKNSRITSEKEEAQARFHKFSEMVKAGEVNMATGTTSNTSQLMPTIVRQDLYLPNLDYDTPLWDSVSKGVITQANPFTLPRFVSASGLSGPHTEGTNPTPGNLGFGTQTIQPGGISGSFKLTREIAMSSNPALDQIALAEMHREYTEDREALLATLLGSQTGYGATGSLSGDAKALIAHLKTQIVAARFRRGGNRINRVVSEQDAYTALATGVDADGRPLLPPIGATNADGSVSGGLEGLSLSGYPVLPAYALLSYSYLFAAGSVWAWASPIQEFRFEEKDGPANIELAHFSLFASAVLRPSDIIRVAYTAA